MKKKYDAIKPNFFLIGAPRSGTTALSASLRAHPQVFLSPMKEPQFFATDFRNRFVRYERTYLRLFATADPSKYRAIGESSTWYLFSRTAVPLILEFQPEARFIVMLRDPADLVISLHRFLVMHGKENIVEFEKAWHAEYSRRQLGRGPLGCGDVKFVLYSEWGRLGMQVQRLLKIVPRDRVFFIVYDDLVREPRQVWLSLQIFLGLDDDGRVEMPRVNVSSQNVGFFLARRAVGIFGGVVSGLLARAGIAWHQTLTFLPIWSLSRGTGRRKDVHNNNQYNATAYQILKKYYREDVALLSSLLERDLSALWGYV